VFRKGLFLVSTVPRSLLCVNSVPQFEKGWEPLL
jgi:hypothetical protein